MISLFLSKRGTTYEQMLSQNGDIILEHCISATVKMERNAIWYLTIEVPESELMGYSVTDESVFKVDLNFIKGQLFRMIYPKYNKTKRTYTFYASHIFFDAQYECMWTREAIWPTYTSNSEPPHSWNEAIKKLNDLISDYKNYGKIPLPYNIIGSDPAPEFVDGIPEDERLVYIRWKKDTGFGIDVNGQSITSGQSIQLYEHNRSIAQRFYVVKRPSGFYSIVYYFGNMNVQLYGVPDSSGLSDGNDICINGPPTEDDGNNDLWQLEWIEEKQGFRIAQKRNTKFGWDNNNGLSQNKNNVDIRSWNGLDSNADNKIWTFTYADLYQKIEWDGKNIIDCMFGTDDNSMSEAFPQVAEYHTTAMLDNYTCYFGDMKAYPQDLMPRQIYLTDKEFTDFKETRTMENVLTGIIPEGSGNEPLQWNDSTGNAGRIAQGPYWDKYEIKRIDKVTYDDIALNTEDPNSNEAFTSRTAYDAALKNRALMDLRKKKYCEPDVQTETSIVDLFRDSNPTVGQAKLNDELIYISDDGTRRQKFYFESLTYDLLMERITNADLVEEMEVE